MTALLDTALDLALWTVGIAAGSSVIALACVGGGLALALWLLDTMVYGGSR